MCGFGNNYLRQLPTTRRQKSRRRRRLQLLATPSSEGIAAGGVRAVYGMGSSNPKQPLIRPFCEIATLTIFQTPFRRRADISLSILSAIFCYFFFFFFVSFLAAPRLFISSRFCSLRRRKYISTCHPRQSTGRGCSGKKIIIIIQIIILARASHNGIQQTARDKSEEVSLQVAVKSEREKKNYCKKTDGGDTKARKVQRKQCMYIDAHTFIHI